MNSPHSLSVCQISLARHWGGAETVARSLNDSVNRAGHLGSHVVGLPDQSGQATHLDHSKYLRWPASLVARHHARSRARAMSKLVCFGTLALGRPREAIRRLLGSDECSAPGSSQLKSILGYTPDVIHLHAMQGRYFDFRSIPALAGKSQIILTLHDMWMFTGGCHHSMGCMKFKSGCGGCPMLNHFSPLRTDFTKQNFAMKSSVYQKTKLRVAAPSRWLLDLAMKSPLTQAIECDEDAQVIANGVDVDMFCPGNQQEARRKIGIPPNETVLLYVARGVRGHPFKDYQTMRTAMIALGSRTNHDVRVLILGDAVQTEQFGRVQINGIEFTQQANEIVDLYQASDIYIHPARAENLPISIAEAMACGLPVIASAVGGIPEMIDNKTTGLLVKPEDPSALSFAIESLIDDTETRTKYGRASRSKACKCFDIQTQHAKYVQWYEKIQER